ncbi:hypothetical protein EAI_00977 [Harpegnathos saltator]|uniref:Uncharacterized protein n=1 Tax=Harpegnathos saltator TaxID=610380 RepID=E2C298_HARSA|nr:hypothetical protein EAI_00977 [Harpegnathos saltator]
MEEACSWPVCLAIRENLLPSPIPHIPILIEDIHRYVTLPDYEENCIKYVQTIGEILPGSARLARLRSISTNSNAEVTLRLENIPVETIYIKDEKGRRLHIWEKFHIFKIFGKLEQKENETVLIAHKLLKVEDVPDSLNMLSLLSAVVRPMYYQ